MIILYFFFIQIKFERINKSLKYVLFGKYELFPFLLKLRMKMISFDVITKVDKQAIT